MITDIRLNAKHYIFHGQGQEVEHAAIYPSVDLSLNLDSGPATVTVRLNEHEIAALRALFDQIEARVMESFRVAE